MKKRIYKFIKFSDLRCYSCGRQNDEKTLVASIWVGWQYEGLNTEAGGARRMLCPECHRMICDYNLKQSLIKSSEKLNNTKQLNIFPELDSAKINIEPISSAVSTADNCNTISNSGFIYTYDCSNYMGAGNCYIRGDAECDDCEDYKSINKNDKSDDD